MTLPRRLLVAAVAAATPALLVPQRASAHALQGRADLPIPEWMFAWGATVVLVASFVGLAVLWQRPRFEGDGRRPLSRGLSRAVANPVTEGLAGLLSVFLLGVVVWSGLAGTDNPAFNFSVTFVFVTVWLGGVLLSVLFGNVWRVLSPWRAVGRSAGWLAARTPLGPRTAPLAYPERFGRWPAVIGLFAFLWLELVWAGGGMAPSDLAIATLIYSAVTWTGMALYGVDAWHDRGETFGSYFRLFSFVSVVESRDRRLGLRAPLTGLGTWMHERGSVALLLLAIGGTTYDGSSAGNPIRGWTADLVQSLSDQGMALTTASRISSTLFMLLVIGFMAAVFWLGVQGIRTVDPERPARRLAAMFGHSLIPIALAYLVAHYFTLFVFQEQAQFTYLLSDPLGDGSNYFGTADGGIDYTLIGSELTWYVQVVSLVAGHVMGLVYAHDKALATYGSSREATRSQYWMLAVMVLYTSLGLYLLSAANQ